MLTALSSQHYLVDMKSPTEPDLLHLLFPHVRAEILRTLFSKPTNETYGREAARSTTLALRTIQRELAMLETAGLLVSRRKEPFRLYRANRDHRLFRPLQQLVVNGDSGRPFVNTARRPQRSRRRWHKRASRREPSLFRPIWERHGVL